MNMIALRHVLEGVAVVCLLLALLALVLDRVGRGARVWRCGLTWQTLDVPPVNGIWVECSEEELLHITRLEHAWDISRGDAARVLLYRGGLQDGSEQGQAQINSA